MCTCTLYVQSVLVITTIPTQQAVQLSVGRPGSNPDLRGSRYPVLPPIGTHSPNVRYEDWKKL